MRSIRMVLVVALFVSLGAVTALAENYGEKIQRRYAQVSTMNSEFTQILRHKNSGDVQNRKGTMLFKKPLLVRWETVSPSPELLLVTSKEVWNVFADEQVAYKYPVSVVDSSTSIIRVLTGQSRLDQDFAIEEAGTDGGLTKLNIFPNEPTQTFVEATLWIEPVTAMIKKIVIFDFYGNENEITFTKQDIGVALPDTAFTYTPPAGYSVEDKSSEDALMGPFGQ